MSTLSRRISSTLLAVVLVWAGACSDDTSDPRPDGSSPGADASVSPGTEAGLSIDRGSLPASDAKVPPQTPPSFINGHVVPACSPGLYQVNAGTVATTCKNIWSTPDDVLQVTIGEVTSKPPTAGRVYTVRPQSEISIYPEDGDAVAVYLKQSGSLPVSSGNFTINPYSGTEVTGSYLVKLPDGTLLRGAFHADTCPEECD